MSSPLISAKARNKLIHTFLIVATILQFMLKLSGSKGLFRYGFMWLTVIARAMFGVKIVFYDFESHKALEYVGFFMSVVMFFSFNASNAFIFNKLNIIIVFILEAVIILLYKLQDNYIVCIEETEKGKGN